MSRGTLPDDLPDGWACYLLLCSDGSYCCGIAAHLRSRLRQHASGKGSTYTKGTRPTTLVWFETHPIGQSAAAREKQIKSWSHKKKVGLADGSIDLGPNARRMQVSLG